MRTRIVWLLDLQAKIPTPSEKSHLVKSYKVYPKWIPVRWVAAVDMYACQRVVERPTLLYCRPMTSSLMRLSHTPTLAAAIPVPTQPVQHAPPQKKMFYLKKYDLKCV